MKSKLLSAIRSNDVETAKLLIENGADVNAKYYEETGFSGGEDYDVEVVRNVRDSTLLMEAVALNRVKIAKLLIENGADVNAKNNYNGWTPLIEAVWDGHIEIAKLLIENGADVDTENNNGETALTIATERGNKDVVKVIKEAMKEKSKNQFPVDIRSEKEWKEREKLR
jgi:ankyrin repeat protein